MGNRYLTDAERSRSEVEVDLRRAIEHLCEPGVITAVVQPIVRPADMVVVGYEALARMPIDPRHPPDWWLDRASEFGLRKRLELACLAAAIQLGAPPDARMLFVNASPSTIAEPRSLTSAPKFRIDSSSRSPSRRQWRTTNPSGMAWLDLQRGVRLAIDDAGAGYSSLRHVVELSPDYLKLDRELVSGVDEDPNRRALMCAVVAFAREVGTSVIAEGVETRGELDVLRDAEVHFVQGYLLARPGAPWPDIKRTGPPKSHIRGAADSHPNFREHGLQQALARVENVLEACEVAAETLYRHSHLLTSLYLERNDELRCVAQRGLWQVLDGMSGTAGITERTWATAKSVVVEDVSSHPDYRVSVPGVVSEICVPIIVNGDAVGSLNVESFSPLDHGPVGDDRVSCPTPRRSARSHWCQPGQLSMASGSSSVGVHLRAPFKSPPAAPGPSPLHRCRRDGLGVSHHRPAAGTVGSHGRRAAGREPGGP